MLAPMSKRRCGGVWKKGEGRGGGILRVQGRGERAKERVVGWGRLRSG